MAFKLFNARFASATLTTVAALVLAACGGGGTTVTPSSTTGVDLVGKYVGTWSTACGGPVTITATGAVSSSKQTVVIKKVSDSSFSAEGGSVDYVGAGCTGTGTPVVGETGASVFTVVGTKTVSNTTPTGTDAVDKLTYPASATTSAKDIIFLNSAGPTLQRGDTSSAKDADGFPTLVFSQRFTK
jgi:hypothetical protein